METQQQRMLKQIRQMIATGAHETAEAKRLSPEQRRLQYLKDRFNLKDGLVLTDDKLEAIRQETERLNSRNEKNANNIIHQAHNGWIKMQLGNCDASFQDRQQHLAVEVSFYRRL